MTPYIEDKSLITFFLRTVITDPKSRITDDGPTVVPITAQTIVDVTSVNTISHIDNVTIDAVPLIAFVDYLYDIKNRKIVFFTAQTGSLSYNTHTGTNWIQPGSTRKQDLTKDSFPRISVIYASRPTEILGNYKSFEVITNRIQIDVWTKKDNVATVDVGGYNSKLGDDKLAMFLGNDIKDKLKANAFDLNSGKHFIDYIPITAPKLEPYNESLNLYNVKLEFFIKSIKL